MSSDSQPVTGSSMPTWVQLCVTLAPAAAWIVFASPIPTIQQISRDKTVGGLPLLPYSSMCVNCFVWIVYGLLKSEATIVRANAVGLVLGAYYFYVFRKHCPPTANSLPGTMMNHVLGVAGILTFTLLLAVSLSKETAAELIGKMGVLFCVILFASPLSVLRDVIVTKSAKNIPLPFTLASTLNCFLWSVAGVLAMKDFNVYFPNLAGLSCCVAQLTVILMYGDGTADKKEASEIELPLTR